MDGGGGGQHQTVFLLSATYPPVSPRPIQTSTCCLGSCMRHGRHGTDFLSTAQQPQDAKHTPLSGGSKQQEVVCSPGATCREGSMPPLAARGHSCGCSTTRVLTGQQHQLPHLLRGKLTAGMCSPARKPTGLLHDHTPSQKDCCCYWMCSRCCHQANKRRQHTGPVNSRPWGACTRRPAPGRTQDVQTHP
jgi:hypothetical protein